MILYDADKVEIYCGMSLAATHDRCDIPYAYSWKKGCNLPGHHEPYDKDLEELFRCVAEIDNIVVDYLREVDRVIQYPPKAFRSCRTILMLEKKYSQWLSGCGLRIGSRYMSERDWYFLCQCHKTAGALKVAEVKGTLETELKKIEHCQLLILDDLSSYLLMPGNGPYCSKSLKTYMAKVHHHNFTVSIL